MNKNNLEVGPRISKHFLPQLPTPQCYEFDVRAIFIFQAMELLQLLLYIFSVGRFDRQSSMPYFLYECTMAVSQSARATSPTSVRQFQTDVGNRQQKDKELARPIKNSLKNCISCLRQFWPVFIVELKSNSQYTTTSLICKLNRC